MAKMREENVLKVFGASHWHGDVIIVGNRQGLESLKASIEKALSSPGSSSTSNMMESDGEGYNLRVLCHDHSFYSDQWNDLPTHYTGDHALENDREERFRKLYKLLVP